MDARIHPYVVHFAVGLLITAVALFMLGTIFRRQAWSPTLLHAARWNLWIGAGCALAAIGTGFLDYLSNPCDVAAIEATVLHRRSGAVTWWSSLVAGIAAYRTRHRAPGPALMAWLLLVAAAAMTATTLGTKLTYDRGLGVFRAWSGGEPPCFELERRPPTRP